jgi:hypothetical protein
MALRFNFLNFTSVFSLLTVCLLLALLLFPTLTYAGDGLVTCGGVDCTFCTLLSTIYEVIRWLTIISAILAGMVLIYAGFKMVTAGGDTSGYVEAKKLFFNAVIGIMIIFAVVAVIYTIMMTILNATVDTVDVRTGKMFGGFDCGRQTNIASSTLQTLDGVTLPPPPTGDAALFPPAAPGQLVPGDIYVACPAQGTSGCTSNSTCCSLACPAGYRFDGGVSNRNGVLSAQCLPDTSSGTNSNTSQTGGGTTGSSNQGNAVTGCTGAMLPGGICVGAMVTMPSESETPLLTDAQRCASVNATLYNGQCFTTLNTTQTTNTQNNTQPTNTPRNQPTNDVSGLEYRYSCGANECPPTTQCPGGDFLVRTEISTINGAPEYYYVCRR